MVLLFLLLLMGAKEAEASPAPYELILDWFPNPNHIPLYVGMERGFFREEGIDLLLRRSPEVILGVTCVATKQADFAITYMPTAIKAELAGLSFFVAGTLIERPLNSLIFPKSLGVKRPEELSGRRLGFSVDGTQETLTTLLKKNGIRPSERLNAHFDLIGMLLTGRVDFIYGAFWNIESEQLQALGMEVDLFPLDELGVPPYHELIVVAHERTLADKFKRALGKSIEEARKSPEEAFEIYWKYQDKKSSSSRAWEERAWKRSLPLFSSSQTIPPTLWEEYREWLLENGLKGSL